MQIHELNNYNGDLDAGAYLAVDNGNDTGRISADGLLHAVNTKIDQVNASLGNRINNIIAGDPAPSAAEVTDARTGATGAVYPSLGDAIRGQVENLIKHTSVIQISSSTANLLDASKVTAGYLDSTGCVIASGDWVTSPFVEVEVGDPIYFSGYNISLSGRYTEPFYFLGVFDENEELLSYTEQTAGQVTVTDVGARYIRFSWHSNTYTDVMLRNDNLYQDYVPYRLKTSLKNGIYVDQETVDDTVDAAMLDIADPAWVDYTTTVTSGKMLLVNGNIIDYAGYSVTDYIDVSDAEVVRVTGASNYQNGIACFYTENQIFLSCALQAAAGGTNTIYTDQEVAVPANAKYLVVGGRTNLPPSASRKQGYILKSLQGVWYDKTWLMMGDSITDDRNTKATKRYFDYIHDKTGINLINGGVSGSGYAKDGESAFGPDTNWHDLILTYSGSAFDVVTFFGSFNDLSSGLPLGTATDSGTSTIGGCINATLDNLFSFKPLAVVGIVTPTPWQYATPSESSAVNYVNLLIEICRLRSIPCLDLFHESLLRPWDATFRALAYSRDGGGGTHPDENGHKLIAPRFEAFLDSLLIH